MNAESFRQYYEYHFSENRKLWDDYVAGLSEEQFTREVAYSHGSVRDQLVHLIDVDLAWFRDLSGRKSRSGRSRRVLPTGGAFALTLKKWSRWCALIWPGCATRCCSRSR